MSNYYSLIFLFYKFSLFKFSIFSITSTSQHAKIVEKPENGQNGQKWPKIVVLGKMHIWQKQQKTRIHSPSTQRKNPKNQKYHETFFSSLVALQ
jgi:hypothetical protein